MWGNVDNISVLHSNKAVPPKCDWIKRKSFICDLQVRYKIVWTPSFLNFAINIWTCRLWLIMITMLSYVWECDYSYACCCEHIFSRRWNDSIKMCFGSSGCDSVDCIHQDLDRAHGQFARMTNWEALYVMSYCIFCKHVCFYFSQCLVCNLTFRRLTMPWFEMYSILGCYTEKIDYYLPTLRDNICPEMLVSN